MSNKISLISLIKDNSVFVQHAQNKIFESVAEFFPETGAFESFDDTRELLKGLSNSFSHSKIVVVCGDSSRYLFLKNLLFQALNLESETSDSISQAIEKLGDDIPDKTAVSHALVPKTATVFISEDGLFSGFAVQSGKQHLIVLPLDLDRVDSIIKNGFTEYIKSCAIGTEAAETAGDVSVQRTAQKMMIPDGLYAAVAANKSAEFVKIKLASISGWENSFKFVPCSEEKNNRTQKEFVADLARQARENGGCPVGLAISNVFSSEKENGKLFVFVTVADHLRARIAKVYAEPGESPRQLVEAAVEKLLIMLGEYTDAGGFTGFPVDADQPDIPEEEIKTRSRLAFKLILSGIAALALCLIIIFFGGHLVKAVRDFSGKGVSAESTQSITNTAAEDSGLTSAVTGSGVSSDDLLSVLAHMSSYASTNDETVALSEITFSPSGSSEQIITFKNTTLPASTAKTTATTKAATTKPTTSAALITSTAVTTTPNTAQYYGTFSFAVKGYGHGVGMSQEGAKAYANDQKWTYDAILLHYYQPGVTIVDDSNLPSSVLYGGISYPLSEYLARTVAAEMGTDNKIPIEALKAQAVAAYTFAKRYSFDVPSNQHALSTTFNMDSNSNVVKAVTMVKDKFLSYEGAAALTPYFTSSAGKTASSVSVWGGSIPYLSGGITSPEAIVVSSKNISSEDFRKYVTDYNMTCGAAKVITLQSNPAQWLEIISKDSAGYVNTIRVGDKEIRGNEFRNTLLKLSIKSHSFDYIYKATL